MRASVQRIGEIKTATGDYQVLVRGDNLSQGTQVMTTALPKAITGLLVDPIRPQIQSAEEALVDSATPQTSLSPERSNPDAQETPLA